MHKKNTNIGSLTPFEDVNEVILYFANAILPILGDSLVGSYLTGSLSYGAFNYNSSDIDITVIVHKPVSSKELDHIRQMHSKIEGQFSKWAKRLECSYTPVGMLPSSFPPKAPRPWYWGGESILYAEAPYGNEWIINNYLLYHYAIPLIGPDFRVLMSPVDIAEVQRACIRDLFAEWLPKKVNRSWFRDSHHESYLIMNLCRILYTVKCKTVGSKKAAASYVINTYGEPWAQIIHSAEQWQYGMVLNLQEKAIEFIDFVMDEIMKTDLYREISCEIIKPQKRAG